MSRNADARLWRVILAAGLGVFAVELDFLAVQAAIPDMARDLGTSVTNLQWVISGYMLANGATLIVCGRIGDLLGRRRWLLVGAAGFGLTSLAGGLAGSSELLIAMRLLQGVAAAFLFPMCLAVVTNAVAPDRVERTVGAVFGLAAVGQALSPLVGGGLTSLFSWRAVLLVNVPVCAALIALAVSAVVESRDETAPRSIDWTGLALVVISISAFTYAVDRASDWGWTSPSTLVLMAAGLAGVALFVAVERRVAHPLMDLSLFHIPQFDLMTVAGTVGNMATASVIFTSMILLQSVDGMSPGEAGVTFLGFALGAAISSQLSGRLERFPAWLVMSVALGTGGTGALVMGLVEGTAPFVVASFVAGLGLGLSWAFTSVATQAVVPKQLAGVASGVVLTVVVTLGGVAVATASTVIESSGTGGSAFEDALRGVLAAAGAFALATGALVALLGRRLTAPVATVGSGG
jgi:MFS family permease